jgi:hypothetical protein
MEAAMERKHHAAKKAAVKNDELTTLMSLLQAAPANGTIYTAIELKRFISTKLDNNFPNIAKKTTLAVIVPYLLKVAELHVAGEAENESLSDAAELVCNQLEPSAA